METKKDFVNCLEKILLPVKHCITPEKSGFRFSEAGVFYTKRVAELEAFARMLWGLAPLWGGGEDFDDFENIYLDGIINGTDPKSVGYWGEIHDYDQKLIEAAPVCLALVLAPEKLWEPLNDKQKENLINWLKKGNEVKRRENNITFFVIFINLALKKLGYDYRQDKIDEAIDIYNSLYKGEGWYTDGDIEKVDWYIPFAIHFYCLIYAKLMEKEDPVNSKAFKERACLFAKDFIYWFADDGAAIPIGRSLTYRFAQCCFWSACVYAGIEPFPIGVMKGIIVRNLEWWLKQPIFDSHGVLTIGYAYPNINMAEEYNSFGSPYWALKAFLVLALDEEHIFFKTKAEPLPELDSLKVMKNAKMVIQRMKDNVVALTPGRWTGFDHMHAAEKYSKFAYCSKYGFSVPRSYVRIDKAATDSMLAFVKDDMVFVRRNTLEYRIEDSGEIYSKWSPLNGIIVETILIPTEDGHIRRHTITSDFEVEAYDCSFATKEQKCKVTGGEEITISAMPASSLMFSKTDIQAVKYQIPVGRIELETVVVYP